MITGRYGFTVVKVAGSLSMNQAAQTFLKLDDFLLVISVLRF